MMQFLLTHWHCVVPVLAIAALVLLRNRAKKMKSGGNTAGNIPPVKKSL
jgi:hypothetical protein